MTISDDTLMAYLDNELPPAERVAVDAALSADQDLRNRLREQEAVRNALRDAFGPTVNERVPDRLVQAALTAPISWRWRLSRWTAQWGAANEADRKFPAFARFANIASLVLIGIAIGWIVARIPVGQTGGGGAIAQGPLAQALERQLAADDARDGPRVGVSFRAKSGRLCRTFDLGAASGNKAGIACRGENAWTVETLVAAEPLPTSTYEPAGSAMPAAVGATLNDLMAGAPLDAKQERQARDRGWRD